MKLEDIYEKIENLKHLKNVEFGIVGKSTLNQDIVYFHVGKKESKTQILVEASIHAREYVTCLVALKQIEYYAKKDNLDFGIYFVPLVNPDGVGLVLNGTKFSLLKSKQKKELIKINNNKSDFSLWKANIKGIDLNVNFDALWGMGKRNVFVPSSENYVGICASNAVEVATMCDFIKKINPILSLSYHSKGEVIFWGFELLNKHELKRDKFIAKKISKYNGYKVIKTKQSTGGLSDYVSKFLRVPSFTVEFGKDSLPHPIGENFVGEIFEQNKDLPYICFFALNKYEKNKISAH